MNASSAPLRRVDRDDEGDRRADACTTNDNSNVLWHDILSFTEAGIGLLTQHRAMKAAAEACGWQWITATCMEDVARMEADNPSAAQAPSCAELRSRGIFLLARAAPGWAISAQDVHRRGDGRGLRARLVAEPAGNNWARAAMNVTVVYCPTNGDGLAGVALAEAERLADWAAGGPTARWQDEPHIVMGDLNETDEPAARLHVRGNGTTTLSGSATASGATLAALHAAGFRGDSLSEEARRVRESRPAESGAFTVRRPAPSEAGGVVFSRLDRIFNRGPIWMAARPPGRGRRVAWPPRAVGALDHALLSVLYRIGPSTRRSPRTDARRRGRARAAGASSSPAPPPSWRWAQQTDTQQAAFQYATLFGDTPWDGATGRWEALETAGDSDRAREAALEHVAERLHDHIGAAARRHLLHEKAARRRLAAAQRAIALVDLLRGHVSLAVHPGTPARARARAAARVAAVRRVALVGHRPKRATAPGRGRRAGTRRGVWKPGSRAPPVEARLVLEAADAAAAAATAAASGLQEAHAVTEAALARMAGVDEALLAHVEHLREAAAQLRDVHAAGRGASIVGQPVQLLNGTVSDDPAVIATDVAHHWKRQLAPLERRLTQDEVSAAMRSPPRHGRAALEEAFTRPGSIPGEEPVTAPFTTAEVRRYLSTVKRSASGGPSGLSNAMLAALVHPAALLHAVELDSIRPARQRRYTVSTEQVCAAAEAAAAALAGYMSGILDAGYLPTRERIGRLTPLVKAAGKPITTATLRPVVSREVMSKFTVGLIADRIHRVLVDEDALGDEQVAFLENRGGAQALLAADLRITHARRTRSPLAVTDCDALGAYDRVSPEWLDAALQRLGVPHAARRLLAHWIGTAKAVVQVGGAQSAPFRTSRLPQGSTASPLLYVLCTDALWGFVRRHVENEGHVPEAVSTTQLVSPERTTIAAENGGTRQTRLQRHLDGAGGAAGGDRPRTPREINATGYADDLRFYSESLEAAAKQLEAAAKFFAYMGASLSPKPGKTVVRTYGMPSAESARLVITAPAARPSLWRVRVAREGDREALPDQQLEPPLAATHVNVQVITVHGDTHESRYLGVTEAINGSTAGTTARLQSNAAYQARVASGRSGPLAAASHIRRYTDSLREYVWQACTSPRNAIRHWRARAHRAISASLGPGRPVAWAIITALSGLAPPEHHQRVVHLTTAFHLARATPFTAALLRNRWRGPAANRGRLERAAEAAARQLHIVLRVQHEHTTMTTENSAETPSSPRRPSRAPSRQGRPGDVLVHETAPGTGRCTWRPRPAAAADRPARPRRPGDRLERARRAAHVEAEARPRATLTIYTDGSASPDGSTAAAAVLPAAADGHERAHGDGRGTGQRQAAQYFTAAVSLGNVARPSNHEAESYGIVLAAAAPATWHPSGLDITVITDSLSVKTAVEQYRKSRLDRERDRSSVRAAAAALEAVEQRDRHVRLQHVHGHQDQSASEEAFWNGRADAAARAAAVGLDHDNPQSWMDLTRTDGPVIAMTAADHPDGGGRHITGDLRAFVQGAYLRKCVATLAQRGGPQAAVLVACGLARVQDLGRAVGPHASHRTQVHVVRVVSGTLPTFDNLLRGLDGVTRLDRNEQEWIRRRWHRVEYRAAQAMRRAPDSNGQERLSAECRLCDNGDDETVSHFVTCQGVLADERRHRATASIATVLDTVPNVLDCRRAAAAVWRRLTDNNVAWAERIGCFVTARITAAVRETQPNIAVKLKNRHIRALRRALIEVSAKMWRRRDEHLQTLCIT